MNFAAAWSFSHMRLHHVLYLAAALQFIGGWIRVLGFLDDKFWIEALGMLIFFVASPMILNSISLIANLWFADNERARATAISGLMPSLGSIIGLGMTGVIAAGVDEDSSADLCMEKFNVIIYV